MVHRSRGDPVIRAGDSDSIPNIRGYVLDMSRAELQTISASLVLVETDTDTDSSIGSGVVIGRAENGSSLVLTCEHCVRGATRISVVQRRDRGKRYSYPRAKATVLAADPDSDLALLHITRDIKAPIMGLADQDPDLYESCYVAAHPNSEQWVCAPATFQGSSEDKLLFYGPVFPGSSGGIVADIHCCLVGLIKGNSYDGPLRMQILGIATPLRKIEKFLKATGGKAARR